MRFLLLVAGLLAAQATFAADTDFSIRTSAFGSLGLLPDEDLLRPRLGPHFADASADVRSMFEASAGGWEFALHHQLIYRQGDLIGLSESGDDTLNRLPRGDDARAFRLSWSLDSDSNRAIWHRFDQVSVGWSNRQWRFRVGRQAVSWGNGLVFQPVDVLNPFSPVAVDTEYKPGDDLVLVERRFSSGQELQAIAVARRGSGGDLSGSSGSYGLRWHSPLGESDLEIFAMRHYGDQMLGLGIAKPLGELLIRGDLLVTRTQEGASRFSAVVNTDVHFAWGETMVNLWLEYFYNGFGEDDPRLDSLSQDLLHRIERGELSTVGKHYLALSARFTPSLRVSYGGLLLANLQDMSVLSQFSVEFLPSDLASVSLGVTYGFADDRGDEYGGLRVSSDPELEQLTSGGGGRVYLRIARYW